MIKITAVILLGQMVDQMVGQKSSQTVNQTVNQTVKSVSLHGKTQTGITHAHVTDKGGGKERP